MWTVTKEMQDSLPDGFKLYEDEDGINLYRNDELVHRYTKHVNPFEITEDVFNILIKEWKK